MTHVSTEFELPVPWHERAWAFLATWWQQIAITQAGIYLVASFGQGHGILPPVAAWALALGMEGTYLKGLIDAGHVRGKGRIWATFLITGTYVTVICWGIAHILSLPTVGVIPAKNLGPVWGTFIALIHILPIAATGFCSAMLHRARAGEALTDRLAREAEARERAQQLQAQLDAEAAEARAAERAAALEQQRKRLDLDLWVSAQEAKARLKANTPPVFAPPARTASGCQTNTGANTPANSSDEQLRAQVVAVLTNNPRHKRTELAASLGIGRTKLYELIDAAIAAGDLPASVKER